jgi:hypothetical protein
MRQPPDKSKSPKPGRAGLLQKQGMEWATVQNTVYSPSLVSPQAYRVRP